MAFRLKSVVCSAQGAWNIYILQPEWLDRKGVFTPGKPVLVEALTAGPGFRFSAGKKALQWVVNPFQVTVAGGPDQGAETGAGMAVLLKALPETPLRNVGFQLEFRGSESVKDQEAVPDLGLKSAPGEPVLSRGVSLVVGRGETRYHLRLTRDADAPGPTLDVTAFLKGDGLAARADEFLQNFGGQVEAVRDIAARHLSITLA